MAAAVATECGLPFGADAFFFTVFLLILTTESVFLELPKKRHRRTRKRWFWPVQEWAKITKDPDYATKIFEFLSRFEALTGEPHAPSRVAIGALAEGIQTGHRFGEK